jgi:hypothetical protein
MNQNQTQDHIAKLLHEKNIPFTEIPKGGIYSIRYPERPLFVAHMDTVGEPHVSRKLTVTSERVTRKGTFVLGADDKAGVNILLDHIDDINFVFTRDEEIGCLGITAMLADPTFVDSISNLPCAIEYDRRDVSDLIPYCDEDLIADIEGLTHYRVARGTFTDVTEIASIIPAVNLSCGYYEAHTGREYLDIQDWRMAHKTLQVLNKNLRGEYAPEPKKSYAGYYSDYNYYDDDEDDYYDRWWSNSSSTALKTCVYCGKVESFSTQFYSFVDNSEVFCETCLEIEYDIRRVR